MNKVFSHTYPLPDSSSHVILNVLWDGESFVRHKSKERKSHRATQDITRLEEEVVKVLRTRQLLHICFWCCFLCHTGYIGLQRFITVYCGFLRFIAFFSGFIAVQSGHFIFNDGTVHCNNNYLQRYNLPPNRTSFFADFSLAPVTAVRRRLHKYFTVVQRALAVGALIGYHPADTQK